MKPMRFRRLKNNCGVEGHAKNSNALLAVVHLHKPFDDDPDECGHCGDGYPCITIQVIKKELD